jgi:hypothetical protein
MRKQHLPEAREEEKNPRKKHHQRHFGPKGWGKSRKEMHVFLLAKMA